VLVLADLVAFDLVLGLDRVAGLAVDELASHPVAGGPVERVEGDALRDGHAGTKRDRTGELGHLEKAFPDRTRRHGRISLLASSEETRGVGGCSGAPGGGRGVGSPDPGDAIASRTRNGASMETLEHRPYHARLSTPRRKLDVT